MLPSTERSLSKRKSIPPSDASTSPRKRVKLLLDDENSSDHSSTSGGVRLRNHVAPDTSQGFNVNQDFARRFEYNKKREELHKLEEKYGKHGLPSGRNGRLGNDNDDEDDHSDSSSTSEDEDDEGVLASEALDAQIEATLKAIRAKDPRVYDEKSTFYDDPDEERPESIASKKSKQKPVYLSDYHRQNLLRAANDTEVQDQPAATYVQQQDDLRSTIVRDMHAAANDSLANDEISQSGELQGDNSEDFLIRKSSTIEQKAHQPPSTHIELDVETADKDPETYLSNFMAARAWVPSTNGAQFEPFESDDDEEDRRAEAFEEAYNMRFENPEGANEKLVSHARDAAAKYSVRKETTNSRKKARDADRAKKEAERQNRDEEKARLRKLQVAEAEDKVRKIKKAAGLRGTTLKEEDWMALLNEGWDDARWEEEMKKRFGDEYYAGHESGSDDEHGSSRKRKPKKPKWDDDIDITDLVPDFDMSEDGKPNFKISEDDDEPHGSNLSEDQDDEERDSAYRATNGIKVHKKGNQTRDRDEQKRKARKERRLVEKLVDEKLTAEETIAGTGGRKSGQFCYRETSPVAFGLTARDILMASDSQLNQYAGLKKMATFRDNDKKRRDKKRLGKKARLRQWRKDTFGSEQGPQKTFADVFLDQVVSGEAPWRPHANQITNVRRERSKKKGAKRDKSGSGMKVEPQ